MKERIVINEELSKIIIENKNGTGALFPKSILDNSKIEKQPETWEELKELCKELKKSSIKILTDTITHKEYVCIDTMIKFYENGRIIEDYKYIVLAENRTPAQMWTIIKNLVE